MDLEYEQALESILSSVPPPVEEAVPLHNAHRRFLARPVISKIDLPPFDNSAVDGYAVIARNLAGASPETPVALRVAGRIAAGQTWHGTVSSGCCLRLFTGSPLPPGADAVAMQEDTVVSPDDPGGVSFLTPVSPGECVRRRGEDVSRGTVLAKAGDVLTAARINLLGASGCAEVYAGRSPRVAILATGSELKEPGTELRPGEIYESNRGGLAAMVSAAGGIPRVLPLVTDDLSATAAALRAGFSESHIVVTSGGVSVGELDFVRQALVDIGGELAFWRVAIRPGRPFVFGRAGTDLFFGLPGNPVSALVTFFLLVRPALLRFQGATEVRPPTIGGVLGEELANPGNRRHFVRVRVDSSGKVYSAGLQASHALSSLAMANGLVDMAPGVTLKAGTFVSVLPWE